MSEDTQKLMEQPNVWYAEEDENSWQLFYGPQNGLLHPYQVIKAPKLDSPMAEYWPTKEQTKFIVDALNEAEKAKKL